MKFFIVPDSFKGGLDSTVFCSLSRSTLTSLGHDVDTLPISDGGDGFVQSLSAILGAETLMCRVTDSNFFIKNVRYGVKDKTAIVGVSECCGLARAMIKDPSFATSYGVGEVISLAKKLNKNKIYIGLGGSATNDGGAGILCALGAKFFDKDGEIFTPVGNTLGQIESIDLTDFRKNIEGLEVIAVCDVKSPLLGEKGCTYQFARQKGAKEEDLPILEENMRHFAEKTAFLGVNPDLPGMGAAGGIGYCLAAFFGAKTVTADHILDLADFDNRVADCDIIVTGEGRYDGTSGEGKLVSKVTNRNQGKPTYVFCGDSDIEGEYVVVLNDREKSLQENVKDTALHLERKLTELFGGKR